MKKKEENMAYLYTNNCNNEILNNLCHYNYKYVFFKNNLLLSFLFLNIT